MTPIAGHSVVPQCRSLFYSVFRHSKKIVKPQHVHVLVLSTHPLRCTHGINLITGNHYSKMFSLRNSDGTPMFHNIQITLVCDKCKLTDHPEK